MSGGTRAPHSKAVFFALEAVNGIACTYYFNYLFFLLRDSFGFESRHNLLVSALHGLIYTVAAYQGGRFAERRGYLVALRVGFVGMGAALVLGFFIPALWAQMLGLGIWTAAMMFTWPALEALVSHNETDAGLQRRIGTYNCVWSGAAAVAYFLGGAVFENLGVGSLYVLPVVLYALQTGLTYTAAAQASEKGASPAPTPEPAGAVPAHHPDEASLHQPIPGKAFLHMAWLANPFAYIAINTVLAIIPDLATRLKLTTTQSGLFCSVWFFARFVSFIWLWNWTGWHYRFSWLAGSFAALVLSFLTLVLSQSLVTLVVAQLVFGLATGLLYYSSLYYSMDLSDAKGEHGGLHEAAIGAGICLGPAVGAASAWLMPGSPNAGAVGVAGLLVVGLIGLFGMRFRWSSRRGVV